MSGSRNAQVDAIGRPEPLQKVLAEDYPEDCLPCRIMGSSAFVALGGYSYFSGRRQLRLRKAEILKSKSMIGFKTRQAGITGIALTLVGMGFWRLVN